MWLGTFAGRSYESIYYKDIKNVNLRVGVIDRMLGVGDVHIDTAFSTSSRSNAFLDIENATEVYQQLQKIVIDIQTDIEFPNAYRPSENPGYNTKYTL